MYPILSWPDLSCPCIIIFFSFSFSWSWSYCLVTVVKVAQVFKWRKEQGGIMKTSHPGNRGFCQGHQRAAEPLDC